MKQIYTRAQSLIKAADATPDISIEGCGRVSYSGSWDQSNSPIVEVEIPSPGNSSSINRLYRGLLASDQSEYPLDSSVREYYISYTINAKQLLDSNYAFTMLIDTPEVRTFSLHGGSNQFEVFIPGARRGNLSGFEEDRDRFIEHYVDFRRNSWSIHIDGIERYRSQINAFSATNLRFSMAPWTGGTDSNASETTITISNFRILTSLPN